MIYLAQASMTQPCQTAGNRNRLDRLVPPTLIGVDNSQAGRRLWQPGGRKQILIHAQLAASQPSMMEAFWKRCRIQIWLRTTSPRVAVGGASGFRSSSAGTTHGW